MTIDPSYFTGANANWNYLLDIPVPKGLHVGANGCQLAQ